jgi:MerR family mercuric resistance operon transcriptional regulator
MNGSSQLQIGEIATGSGVSIDTVRYYERLKLLPRAARLHGGFRVFPIETVERIKFIKQAQEMGFSLEEIKQLFLTEEGKNKCESVRELLLLKLIEMEAKINQMKRFKSVLKKHLMDCENELKIHGEQSDCPVMVTIEKSK